MSGSEQKQITHEFSIPIRVYIEDTDAGGIVFYVNYLKYMERARTEFMRHIGFEQKLSSTSEYQFVVHRADMKFHKPARMDMLLDVSVRVLKIAKTYFVVEQHVRNEKNDQLFCSAEVKVACVNYSTFKPQAIPESVLLAMKIFSNN